MKTMQTLKAVLLAGYFLVTWSEWEARQVTYWSNLASGPAPSEVIEVTNERKFDDMETAVGFIESEKDNRKMWDFKLYEVREIKP